MNLTTSRPHIGHSSLCDWFILLSIMPSRFVHVIAHRGSSFLFMTEERLACNNCVYHTARPLTWKPASSDQNTFWDQRTPVQCRIYRERVCGFPERGCVSLQTGLAPRDLPGMMFEQCAIPALPTDWRTQGSLLCSPLLTKLTEYLVCFSPAHRNLTYSFK